MARVMPIRARTLLFVLAGSMSAVAAEPLPERVEFNPQMGPDAHTLEAEVQEFVYMGDVFRTRLKVAGKEDFVVQRGERIAQMVIAQFTQVAWDVRDSLDETERGTGGFGSTGGHAAL